MFTQTVMVIITNVPAGEINIDANTENFDTLDVGSEISDLFDGTSFEGDLNDHAMLLDTEIALQGSVTDEMSNIDSSFDDFDVDDTFLDDIQNVT